MSGMGSTTSMRTSHNASVLLSDEALGQWLREYRREHGLSQHDAAHIIFCDQAAVSRIETGRRKLTAAEFLALQAWSPGATTSQSADAASDSPGVRPDDHIPIMRERG